MPADVVSFLERRYDVFKKAEVGHRRRCGAAKDLASAKVQIIELLS